MFFSILCRKIASKKTFAPPKRCPLAPPFIYRSHAAWYDAKGWTEHVRGLFSVKKPPVSSIQAAFGYIPQPPQPPPRKGRLRARVWEALPDRAHLERLRPVFQVCGRKQPFGVFTSAIGARRTGFIGADHVFKLARAGRAIKIVHRHKGITPF